MDQEKINQFREEQAKLQKEQAKAKLSIDNAQKIKNSVDNSTIQNKANADQITSAVNNGANVTAEEVKKSSSNILSALDSNSSTISDALNNLVVATVMSRDPELVNVVSNFTELLSSLSNASDKLGKSPLNEIPTVNKQLTKALQDFVKMENDKEEPDYTKAFDNLQKAIEKLDIKPVVNVPKQELKIDFKPIERLLSEVKDAVASNQITIPETNLDGVIIGLQNVQDSITGLRFPVPNFMLPFVNSAGKDSQVQLNADGSLPVNVTIDSLDVALGSTDTFDSMITASRYNQIEVDYSSTAPASIADITVTNISGGSSSNVAGQAKFTSGTNTSGGVKAVTVSNTTYRPHYELYAAFTAIFTTGIANSYQRIGLYDANNGFFIGYEGTSFGVTIRNGGSDITTAQANFNIDTLTGNASSKFTKDGVPVALDTTKDNLYRIRFGWLGAAVVTFEVYDPDGTWVAFHKIKVANTQTSPHIQNPNLPLTLDIKKTTAGATELIMYTACWAAGSTSNLVKLTDTLTDNTLASLNRSVITGRSSAGGGTYNNVKVTPSGSLTTAIGDITGVVGQNTMANSLPVAIASNQSVVPVSGTVSVTGVATSANQSTMITSLGNIDTDLGTQADTSATTDTGTFSLISLFKRLLTKFTTTANGLKVDGSAVTQPVSGSVTANIGTSGSLALDATLTGGTQTSRITDGTNTTSVLKSDNTAAGQNAVMIAPTAYNTTFTTTAAGNFATTDMTNYASVSVHLTSAGTSSVVTPQWSNDNTNWVGGSFTQINGSTSAAATTTSSGAMVLYSAKHGRYFRLAVTGITAGTTAGSLHFSTTPTAYQTVGGSNGISFQTGSNSGSITTSSTVISSTSVSGYSVANIQLSGTYSGIQFTITASNDGGTTYHNVPFYDITAGRYYKAGATVAPTDNSTNIYQVQLAPQTATVRVTSTAFTSGSGAIAIKYAAQPIASPQINPLLTTHTALPTATTTPNATPALADKFGRQVVIPGTVRDLVGTQTTTISASTAETTIVTAAASTFNDLTAITVANTSTTPVRVDFRNTTAGSVIFSLYVPGSDVRGITFQRPVPQASVNTNWTAQSSASVTDLRVFAVFDKNA